MLLTRTFPEMTAGALGAPNNSGTPLGPVPMELIWMVSVFSFAGAILEMLLIVGGLFVGLLVCWLVVRNE